MEHCGFWRVLTLDIIVGGKEAHILPVFAVMLISMLGRAGTSTMRPMRRQKPDILWQQRKSPYRNRLYIPVGFLMTLTASKYHSGYYYYLGCPGKQ